MINIWLPFSKDFRNIGLTNCSVVDNGAVMDNDSVVGACVKFNPDVSSGGTKYITLANKTYELMEDDSSFSVAAFIKITGSFYSNGAGIFGAIQYRTSGVGICITSARKIHLQVAYGDGESEFNSTTSIPTNEWHHICVTYKKETKKAHFYLDGVLDGECTLASPWINNRSYNILIGKGSQGGWGYTFPGLMKDFRVYNHELKEWEIKKLANMQMFELESGLHLKSKKNLFAGKTVSQQGGTWTLLDEKFNGFPVYNNVITNGTAYNDAGFSLKTPIDYDGVSTHVTVSFYIRLHVPWNNNIHGYLQVSRTDNTTTNYTWNFPNGVTNSSDYLDTWRRVTNTVALTNISTISQIKYCYCYGDKDGQGNADFACMQLEYGTEATPYADGYREERFVDSSGLGKEIVPYNIIQSGSSLWFNGSNASIQAPIHEIISAGTWTINVWFYRPAGEFGTKSWETLVGGPSGFELESTSSTTKTLYVCPYSWGGGKYAYEANKWNMVTLTRTSSGSKLYINGTLVKSGSAGSMPSGDYFIGAWKTYSQQNFKGYMKRFSIYKTALTEEDIKNLYINNE